MSGMVHCVCEPQALKSWVLQIVTMLTTHKQRRLLRLEHLRFLNTLHHLFHASAKIPPSNGKRYGGTIHISISFTFYNLFRKIAKHFRVLWVELVMVAHLKVFQEADNIRRIAKETGLRSREDPRRPRARASRVAFITLPCKHNSLSSYLQQCFLCGFHIGLEMRRLRGLSNVQYVIFFYNCCGKFPCSF